MSTSTLYHAFQIDGVKYKSTSYEESALIFNAEMSEKYLYCPRCKSRDISFKGQKKRKFHLPPIGGKKCFLGSSGKSVPAYRETSLRLTKKRCVRDETLKE